LIRQAEEPTAASISEDFVDQVQEVLSKQLGHKVREAREMITAALRRNRNIATAEELFEEVYRGEAS
jgi:Holliday junction DNA helicase RuvA